MKYMSPAVYDRSLDDLTNKTAKAYFNVVDWIRIHNNAEFINILISFLLKMDIAFDEEVAPTINTIPTADDLNRLIGNIERIRATNNLPEITGLAELKVNWGSGSASAAPDYLDANSWEWAIEVLLNKVPIMVEYVCYCGVASVGQISIYQKRFRQYRWVEDLPTPYRRARLGNAACGIGLTRNNTFRRYA